MIYLTGDIHGNPLERLSDAHLDLYNVNLTASDYLIILGDFGIVMGESEHEEALLDYLQ